MYRGIYNIYIVCDLEGNQLGYYRFGDKATLEEITEYLKQIHGEDDNWKLEYKTSCWVDPIDF